MDNDFYRRMEETALRLITEKGTPCIITSSPASGVINPNTGRPSKGGAITVQNGRCVLLNYDKSLVNMPESLIEQGDKKILVAAKGVNIDGLNGTIEALGRKFTVVAVAETNPAGLPLVYEVHGRE